MAECGPGEHEAHSEDTDDAADVEQGEGMSAQSDGGAVEERDIADAEEEAQFGRAEAPERHVEGAQDVGGEVDLDGEKKVGDQEAEGDEGVHVAGEGETAHEEEGADGVGDVVDVEAVARAEAIADAGEGAVEAVAEPVDGEGDDRCV